MDKLSATAQRRQKRSYNMHVLAALSILSLAIFIAPGCGQKQVIGTENYAVPQLVLRVSQPREEFSLIQRTLAMLP